MESHRKGDLTEAVVIAEMKRRDIAVSIPFGDNERYDLAVEAPAGELLRAQVKTAWLDDGCLDLRGYTQHTNASGNVRKEYVEGIDCVLAYSHDLETLYLLTPDEFRGQTTLRVDAPTQVHETMNWAEDFEFDERWPPVVTEEITRRNSLRKAIHLLDQRDTEYAEACDDTPYDLLLADADDEFHPVAVRAGHRDSGTIRFAPLDSPDTPGVEFHLIVHPDEATLYCLHDDEFGRQCRLRVDPPAFETSQINWAEEYEFDTRWPPAT